MRPFLLLAVVCYLVLAGCTGGPAPGSRGEPALQVVPDVVDFGVTRVGAASDARGFGVTNVGGGEMAILGFDVTGPGAAAFRTLLDGCTGASLGPAASCHVTFVSQPEARGAHSATVVLSAENATELAVELVAVGGESELVATPAALDFGDVRLGAPAVVELAAAFTNEGEVNASVAAAGLVGAHAAEFSVVADACGGATLLPGASCVVRVTARPTALGAREAVLSVASDGPGSPASVTLAARGTAPVAEASPAARSFGEVPLGTSSATRAVTVTNAGTADLSVDAIRREGANLGDFIVEEDACSGATLAPGASCRVALVFTPRGLGAREATLVVASNAPRVEVPLSGTGVAGAGEPSITPALVDFGNVSMGARSEERAVTVLNTGEKPLALGSIALSGDVEPYDVAHDGCSGVTLEPGASCVVRLAFTPSSAGKRTAEVRFEFAQGTPGGAHRAVPLVGTGA